MNFFCGSEIKEFLSPPNYKLLFFFLFLLFYNFTYFPPSLKFYLCLQNLYAHFVKVVYINIKTYPTFVKKKINFFVGIKCKQYTFP